MHGVTVMEEYRLETDLKGITLTFLLQGVLLFMVNHQL